jgi:UDP-GlcNAc:undecaprenyl-phosphate GlcNAc-1-phosphate transferase
LDAVGKMRTFPLAFLLALACTALLVPVVRRIAIRFGAVSMPGGRNVNARTIPRLGGIAIAVGFTVPMLTILLADSAVAAVMRAESRKVAGLLMGAMLCTLLGVVDDTRHVPPMRKLLVQVLAASIAFVAGFRIDGVSVPWVGTFSMGAFALPVTIAWVVGITNAVNLIDGLDGLAAGIAFFAALTNLVVASLGSQTFVGVAMATLLGALLGFLFFNFNPARIFMGDSGSYFVGFVLGTMSLAGSMQKTSTAVSLLVPVLALGVPIFDTLFTMLRRFLERRPIFSPDRGHIHHRLLDMGLTQRRVVLILYGASLVLTCAAIGVSLGTRWTVGLALLAASAILIALVRSVGYVEYTLRFRRQRARLRSEDAERLRHVLPKMVRTLASAETELAVFGALEQLLAHASLQSVELVPARGEKASEHWADAEVGPRTESVSARYPLGDENRACSHLRVRWCSASGVVDAQAEVLLQVVADVVAEALDRVGSKHAPRSASLPQASSAEVALSLPAAGRVP